VLGGQALDWRWKKCYTAASGVLSAVSLSPPLTLGYDLKAFFTPTVKVFGFSWVV